MTASALEPARGPRRALAGGAAALMIGLAAVGVGATEEGGVVALAGLLVTIYGIHRCGRLGPDDPTEVTSDVEARVGAAADATWIGGLVLVAGAAFLVGGVQLPALLAAAVGVVRLVTGYRALQEARKALDRARSRPKVEKRRRMRKSAAP